MGKKKMEMAVLFFLVMMIMKSHLVVSRVVKIDEMNANKEDVKVDQSVVGYPSGSNTDNHHSIPRDQFNNRPTTPGNEPAGGDGNGKN